MTRPRQLAARVQLLWWTRPGVILGLVLAAAAGTLAAGLILALGFPGPPACHPDPPGVHGLTGYPPAACAPSVP